MANAVGFVDDTLDLAHYALVEFIKDFCDAEGWTIHRYDTADPDKHELIMSAPGYIGPDGPVPVYCGIRTYHSVASDYYNILLAGMTGYVSANAFEAQPGYFASGVPTHNQRIDYWLTLNDRRIAFGLKVGTPVYESGYLGFGLPAYATPRQFPYPLICGGMLSGMAATRFSDTAHSMSFKGNRLNMGLRFNAGAWINPYVHPWGNTHTMAGASQESSASARYSTRPTGVTYPIPRAVMHDGAANVFCEVEGIRAVTGFDSVVENTFVSDGQNFVVIQDVARTGFIDYFGLVLEA